MAAIYNYETRLSSLIDDISLSVVSPYTQGTFIKIVDLFFNILGKSLSNDDILRYFKTKDGGDCATVASMVEQLCNRLKLVSSENIYRYPTQLVDLNYGINIFTCSTMFSTDPHHFTVIVSNRFQRVHIFQAYGKSAYGIDHIDKSYEEFQEWLSQINANNIVESFSTIEKFKSKLKSKLSIEFFFAKKKIDFVRRLYFSMIRIVFNAEIDEFIAAIVGAGNKHNLKRIKDYILKGTPFDNIDDQLEHCTVDFIYEYITSRQPYFTKSDLSDIESDITNKIELIKQNEKICTKPVKTATDLKNINEMIPLSILRSQLNDSSLGYSELRRVVLPNNPETDEEAVERRIVKSSLMENITIKTRELKSEDDKEKKKVFKQQLRVMKGELERLEKLLYADVKVPAEGPAEVAEVAEVPAEDEEEEDEVHIHCFFRDNIYRGDVVLIIKTYNNLPNERQFQELMFIAGKSGKRSKRMNKRTRNKRTRNKRTR